MDEVPPSLSIREVSQRSGCTASALRYYEAEGLIAALPRTPTASRRYLEGVLAALYVITALRGAGFGMQDIRQFMGVKQPGEPVERRLERTLKMLDGMQATLNERRAALEKAEQLLQEWREEIRVFKASQPQ